MPKYDLETRKAAIQRYKLTDYKVAVCKEFNISRVTLRRMDLSSKKKQAACLQK